MSPATRLINMLASCGITVAKPDRLEFERYHNEVRLDTLRDAALRVITESTGRQSATDIMDSVAALFKGVPTTPAFKGVPVSPLPESNTLQCGISFHSLTNEPLEVNGVPYSVFEGKQYWGFSACDGQGEQIDLAPSDANNAIELTYYLWLLQKDDKVFMVEFSPWINEPLCTDLF